MCDKFRNWCFTLNNPTQEDSQKLLPVGSDVCQNGVKFIKFQLEKGEEGTPHFQGLVIMNSRCRLKTMKKMSERAHWEPMKSLKGSLAYCEKSETRVDGPWERGVPPKVQGQRTDLETVARLVQDGASMTDVAEEYPVMIIKYHKGIQVLRNLVHEKRSWVTELHIYTGATGTGKTRTAFELCENPFMKPSGDWWDGYDGNEDVIIDDFACNMPITELLRLADRYPMQVPIKGNFVQFVAKRIFITSNIPFENWYSCAREEHVEALKRRVTNFRTF